jgi:glycerophosphoryl diester phosphodiesterase
MLLFAHRGYHAQHPENTLAAFAAARDRRVDGIETDVRLSRDGQALLIHDRLLRVRGAGQPVPVAELTRQETEQALAHEVPALADALDAFPDLVWNVEIKTADVLAESVHILKQYRGRVRLLVSSFRHDVVARCAELLNVDCALLVAHRPLDLASITTGSALGQRVRSIVWDYNVVDEAMVWEARAAGWASYVYGAETDSEHAHCARLELQGLITDFPERVPR